MGQKVLVTGGAGFIGSHLVERLIERGDDVWVVDDLSTGRLRNLEKVRGNPLLHLVVDSIMNWPMMNEVVEQMDVVYHMAAAEGMKKLMQEPVETIVTNVRGTEILFECCGRRGCPVFLASTSEIYGKSTGKLREDQERLVAPTTRRQWAYAQTKTLAEVLGLAYWEERGLPVVVGRIFNTAGARQRGRWGMVVPTFVAQAQDGEPITVHGTGEQRRSFLHVDDCVDAILGLMDRSDAAGEAFNIGDEREISILELAHLVKDRLSSGSEVRTVPYEDVYGEGFEDLERRRPDSSKIRRFLGWEPSRSLEEIVDGVAEERRLGGPARSKA
jgi:UDP-glucose 4-epimerase